MKFLLNGSDWTICGWYRNQWKSNKSMEIGTQFFPAIPSIPAKVPGAVQESLIKAGILENPKYGLDSLKGEWVNNREWFYDKEFELPENANGEKYILCLEGLDYSGEIYLNSIKLTEFEGMFIPVSIDITGIVRLHGKNHIRVVFFCSPEVDGQFGYTSRIKHLKSRFNYIWDWCPRIIPIGIWDDVYIKVFNRVHIKDFNPRAIVEDMNDRAKIDIQINIEVFTPGRFEFVYHIYFKNSEVSTSTQILNLSAANLVVEHELPINDVCLWWPNGYGEQNLYKIEIEIYTSEGIKCSASNKYIGFRKIEFVQNENAPPEALPYTLILNEKRIFLKGVNWVPISPLYGMVTREQYTDYLRRFRDMNCNILRVWGGGILEKEDFYDVCDEIGLMVWQEFPQSSSGFDNTPPDDAEYLKKLEQVAAVYIQKKRHHACHIIWCGGNELMWENYKPVNENHINIKILKELVKRNDPTKGFLPCSASGPSFCASREDFGKGVHHDVHGPWNYLGSSMHYSFFNGDDSLLRSETGCPGISRIETLVKYKGKYDLWPPDITNLYWAHRGAWWIQLEELTGLFGQWAGEESIEFYVKASRYIQAEALRYAAESALRREPSCSGFIIWMGNESFPNNSNTSVLEYDGTPKPSYYWIRDAFKSLHISAEYQGISYNSGENFVSTIYLTGNEIIKDRLNIKALIMDIRGNILAEEGWISEYCGTVKKVGIFQWKVASCESNIFFMKLILQKDAEVIDECTYIFSIDSYMPFQPLRYLPECEVIIEETDQVSEMGLVLYNISSTAAVGIFIYSNDTDTYKDIYPNYFTLMPGEKKHISLLSSKDTKECELCVKAINMKKQVKEIKTSRLAKHDTKTDG